MGTRKARYSWIYDNMIASAAGNLQNGGTVYLYDDANKFLGSAVYNENSRIRARVFSLQRQAFDDLYVDKAIEAALARRRPFFEMSDSFRVVFGDADFLPGLVVDKIGSVVVIQYLTMAADQRAERVRESVRRLLSPEAIVERRESPLREKEGLEIEETRTEGDVPGNVRVEQDGFVLYANPLEGQKTGLFLDQRFNRRLIAPYCSGKRVLDAFCHVGGWAMAAAKAGGREVIGVDSSGPAIELARLAAKDNGFEQVHFEETDAFDYLTNAMNSDEVFDLVVVDPPAFAKTRKHVADALKAYLSLNYRAMKLLPVGGVLVTCSCSQQVTREEFEEMLETCARNARMQFHMVARGGQPPDHPIMLGFDESEYLKCCILQRVE